MILNEKYKPKDSSSFSMYNKKLWNKWGKNEYMVLGYDNISFEKNNNNNYNSCNISFLLQISEEEEIEKSEILPKEYFGKIGLDVHDYYSYDNCPNFISGLRNSFGLDKYTFSFEFTNSTTGYLIIGEELYNYNPKKYYKSQYVNTYTNDEKELFFNDIILPDNSNNRNISFNGTYGHFLYNLNLIIGSKEYKQEIDNIFFNKLISENICQINNVTYNNSNYFFVYNCDANKVNLKLFPKLIFVSKDYGYNFVFTYSDLFIKINNKYYFLIIFKANDIKKFKDKWILGQIFYTKYSFSTNADARIIGFYNHDLPIDKDEIMPNETKNNDNKNNYDVKKVIIIVILVVIIIGLLILVFYLGMKMKENRKKRANELKDDNYEYFSEDNTNNNNQFVQNIN